MNIGRYNEHASNTSGVRPVFQYGNPFDQMRYIEALRYVKRKDVLDIACGIGWGSYLFAKAEARSVTGIDISMEALDSARKYYSDSGISYLLGKADAIPCDTSSFDCIVTLETLEHVKNPKAFLRELHRVGRSRALLILSTPNGDCLKMHKNDKPYDPYHFDEYSKEDLDQMISVDWEIIEYKGQGLVDSQSGDLLRYRRWIKNYWAASKAKRKYGDCGMVLFKIMQKLGIKNCIRPEIVGGFSPSRINVEGMIPTYHFYVCRSKGK